MGHKTHQAENLILQLQWSVVSMLIGKLNLRLKKGFVQAASLRKCGELGVGTCLPPQSGGQTAS